MTASLTVQDTGKFRKNLKDQYYTRPAIAAACVAKILTYWPDSVADRWVEPAAGEGVFPFVASSHGIHDIDAMDIDPPPTVSFSLQKRDFLTWTPDDAGSRRVVLFGNPPFGRQGSLAKRFILHGSSFADRIAFILPRSFQKPSMSRAFPDDYHCILSEELPLDSFLVNGERHSVPCVFQLWERRIGVPRAKPTSIEPEGFTYVSAIDTYDIVVRRVGVRAGAAAVAVTGITPSPQSHHFLRLEDAVRAAISVTELVNRISAHTFPTNTTGPRSLSKSEINTAMNAILAELT